MKWFMLKKSKISVYIFCRVFLLKNSPTNIESQHFNAQKPIVMKLSIHRISFFLLIFIIFSFPVVLKAQDPKLYFTHIKNYDYSNVETFKSFNQGDSIYGLLYVPERPAGMYQFSLDSYTIVENGERVVPVTLDVSGYRISIKYNVPLASGMSTKKKSGLLKLITSDNGTAVFYFPVFPTNGNGLSNDWVNWFGMLAANFKNAAIDVTVGPYNENLKSTFLLDLSNGNDSYSIWGAAYLNELKKNQDGQKRKKDSTALAVQNKKDADSVAKWKLMNDQLSESDKMPVPVSKVKKPATETIFVDYANSNEEGIKILRAFIYSDEGFHSDHDYVVNFAYKIKNDYTERCFLLPAKIHTENPLNEREYVKEFKWYDIQSRRAIRCSRIPAK